MTTPIYRGPGQPPPNLGGGWLGRLGAFFGAQAPTYFGDGQPSSSVGVLGRVTPAYMPAPTVPQEPNQGHLVSPDTPTSCPIDPVALANGRIAIVIPRNCAETDREEQAATD